MLLRIQMNPNMEEPGELFDTLNDLSIEASDDPIGKQETLDKAGFNALKALMAENPRIKVY